MTPSRRSDVRGIAAPVLRRLAKYLTHLQALCDAGVGWVSSRELAAALGLTSSTVRQDLSHVRFTGMSRRGYRTDGLRDALTRDLGVDRPCRVVVVGAGNLGRAIAAHSEFARRGFPIDAVFDRDPRVIGRRIGGLTVLDMADLDRYVREHPVDIGILAVPASAAQQVAERLARAGVRGLLNLAPVHVRVADVPVVDARIVTSLMELAYAVRCGRRG